MGRLLEENVELETDLEEGLWPVKVDPSQIDQVIMNLAVNARDAMPHGGKLLIETRNVKLDEEYAERHPGVAKPGDFVMIAVSDNGTGMDKETMSHLFEPFFTTKEVGKGTGLGLSTVYGIVKQSGGNIWAYSEPGKGTSLKIYLPRVREGQVPQGGQRAQPSLADERHAEGILVVEDDEAVRSLVPVILRKKGYTVFAASDGEEALRIFQNHEGKIDLVITDVIMPRMNGKKLADELRKIRSDLKVIFTSGYTSNTIVHHGVLDPGVIFVEKPITAEHLLKKVREALDGEPA
jgi:two-component system cell cycle sensor histidine kinase/response regulator CckA